MSIVIDIAWSRPSVAEIKATGATGVIRYFSGDATKNLTAAEVVAYHAAGLGVGDVWETSTGRATQGYTAGVNDAQAAQAQRSADGLPTDQVIYFAVDEDTSWASVSEYFRGTDAVMGARRDGTKLTGVYGGIRVIDGAAAAGFRFLWQTLAWSAGQRSPHAVLYQDGRMVLSGNADVNQVLAPDWGQFPSPTPTPPVPPATLILQGDDMPSGQLAPGFGADGKGNVTHPELASVVWLGGKNAGAVGGSWLGLFCDFGTARVRVAIHGPKGWDIRLLDLDSSKPAQWVTGIADGATHASIVRVDRGTATAPDKSANLPVGWGTVMEIK